MQSGHTRWINLPIVRRLRQRVEGLIGRPMRLRAPRAYAGRVSIGMGTMSVRVGQMYYGIDVHFGLLYAVPVLPPQAS